MMGSPGLYHPSQVRGSPQIHAQYGRGASPQLQGVASHPPLPSWTPQQTASPQIMGHTPGHTSLSQPVSNIPVVPMTTSVGGLKPLPPHLLPSVSQSPQSQTTMSSQFSTTQSSFQFGSQSSDKLFQFSGTPSTTKLTTPSPTKAQEEAESPESSSPLGPPASRKQASGPSDSPTFQTGMPKLPAVTTASASLSLSSIPQMNLGIGTQFSFASSQSKPSTTVSTPIFNITPSTSSSTTGLGTSAPVSIPSVSMPQFSSPSAISALFNKPTLPTTCTSSLLSVKLTPATTSDSTSQSSIFSVLAVTSASTGLTNSSLTFSLKPTTSSSIGLSSLFNSTAPSSTAVSTVATTGQVSQFNFTIKPVTSIVTPTTAITGLFTAQSTGQASASTTNKPPLFTTSLFNSPLEGLQKPQKPISPVSNIKAPYFPTIPIDNTTGSYKADVMSPQSEQATPDASFESSFEFTPLVTLPELSDIKSGEEDEEELFSEHAKLYRFADKQWKDRGRGHIKILRHKMTGKIRLLMRREKILKICCNHYVTHDTKLMSYGSGNQSWMWFTPCDFADEYPQAEKFLVKFKIPETATGFKEALQKAIAGEPIIIKKSEKQIEEVSSRDVDESKDASTKKWECASCYLHNNQDVDKCAACSNPRYIKKPLLPAQPLLLPDTSTNVPLSSKPGGLKVGDGVKLGDGLKFGDGLKIGDSGGMKLGGGTKIAGGIKLGELSSTVISGGGLSLGGSSLPSVNVSSPPSGGGMKLGGLSLLAPAAITTGKDDAENDVEDEEEDDKEWVTDEEETDEDEDDESETNGDSLKENEESEENENSIRENEEEVANEAKDEEDSVDEAEEGEERETKGEEDYIDKVEENKERENEVIKPTTEGNGAKPNLFGSLNETSLPSFSSLAQHATFNFSLPLNQESVLTSVPPVPLVSPNKDNSLLEEECNVHFKPLVSLPELPTIQTGEEQEEVIFNQRAKLYRYDDSAKQWKERGIGDLKILGNKASGRKRVVMRREQILKLCCNHIILPEMKLHRHNEKAWNWFTPCDFSEEDSKSEKFVARFKTVELAESFKSAFENDFVRASPTSDTEISPSEQEYGHKEEHKEYTSAEVTSQPSIEDKENTICTTQKLEDKGDNEVVMFSEEAILSVTDRITKSVVEKGRGQVKIYRNTETQKVRVFMSSADGSTLCCHGIDPFTQARRHSESSDEGDCSRQWTTTADYSSGEKRTEWFKITFSTPDTAENFQQAFSSGFRLNLNRKLSFGDADDAICDSDTGNIKREGELSIYHL